MATAINTVLGPVAPHELGPTLAHEHILVDFGGADVTGEHRWNKDAVVDCLTPHLQAVRRQGFSCFVDCTPAFLGRDPVVLQRLAKATRLHILTNTGLYKEPYLPQYAFTLTAEKLASRWITEVESGIGNTGVRPAFIKIAINSGQLLPIQQKIVRAAAITHLATGLPVACHSGEFQAAHEALQLVAAEGMNQAHFIVVHADSIANREDHLRLAEKGAWLEYDSIGNREIAFHMKLITWAVERGLAPQLLLSHDAGWYRVEEPDPCRIRPFTALHDHLWPALMAQGVLADLLTSFIVENPQRAFTPASH